MPSCSSRWWPPGRLRDTASPVLRVARVVRGSRWSLHYCWLHYAASRWWCQRDNRRDSSIAYGYKKLPGRKVDERQDSSHVGFMVFPTDNRGSTNIQVVISVKVPSLEGLFAPRRKDFLTIPATDASLALFIETQGLLQWSILCVGRLRLPRAKRRL
jgi:hypothetical protein